MWEIKALPLSQSGENANRGTQTCPSLRTLRRGWSRSIEQFVREMGSRHRRRTLPKLRAHHPTGRTMFERLSPHAPKVLSVLRIVSGLLFLAHGTQKLIGFPPTEMQPPLMSMFGAAGVIEIVTGVLITLGLFTRPAALLASGTMAAAYWIAHAPASPYPVNNGGDAAILFCFVFLYLVFAGPGAWRVNDR
jgi:putative oxidoreductase